MSPRIEMIRDGVSEVIADVPDISKVHRTPIGRIEIDMQAVRPELDDARMRLSIKRMDIRDEVIGISSEGRGELPLEGGRTLAVQLHAPLRDEGEWRRVVARRRRWERSLVPYSSQGRFISERITYWKRRQG